MLLYKFGMTLFVAFGPLFIARLLFKQTASLFNKWLMYGIGLMFANAVVADISMDLTLIMAKALFVTNLISSAANAVVPGTVSEDGSGVMQAATQQLGRGLLLSTLIVAVPPMAANFFSGMVTSFSAANVLAGMGAAWAPREQATQQKAGNKEGTGGNNDDSKNNRPRFL